MRFSTLATFTVMAVAMAVLPLRAMAATQDFTLINSTGYEIKNIYVSPTSSNDWGDDVLGEDTLADGDSQDITFPDRTRTCHFDLKVTYEDDTSHEWHNLNLCEISKVTIHYDEGTHETSATSE